MFDWRLKGEDFPEASINAVRISLKSALKYLRHCLHLKVWFRFWNLGFGKPSPSGLKRLSGESCYINGSWRSYTSSPQSTDAESVLSCSPLSSPLVWGALIRPPPHISYWGLSFIRSLGLLRTVHCTYWRASTTTNPEGQTRQSWTKSRAIFHTEKLNFVLYIRDE